MKKFGMMYQIMYDDLKDADMIIGYACEVKEHHPDLGECFAKYAKYRLDHFMEMHKTFVNFAMKHQKTEKDVSDCLWDITHKHMQEWYTSIEEKIKEY